MIRLRPRARLLRMRARHAWFTVRPRSRRSVGAFVVLAGGLSLFLFAGARIAPGLVSEYGFRPDVNSAAWRALQPAYGEVALCARCHTTQFARLTSATHAGIGCESCHGPQGVHALAIPGTAEAELDVAVPTDELCVKCHVAVEGRPAGFRQIVPADHYTKACLACHDPHTAISRRPPVVEHPLGNLPPCITCHGPDGFKARSLRHPIVAADDRTCLACHQAGRGPTRTDGPPTQPQTGLR